MASSDRRNPSPDPSTLNLISSEELIKGQGCNRPPAVVGSKRVASSSTSLSSQSCKGGSEKRVQRKRKARRSGRADEAMLPAVRRLFAEKSDFKDIVHQFTGNPARPPPAELMPSSFNVAAEFQPHALLAAAVTQSLSTLDIISCYLLRLLHGSSQEKFMMLSEINRRKSLALLQVLMHSRDLQEGPCSEVGTINNPRLPLGVNNPLLSPPLWGDLDSLSPSPCGGGGGLGLNFEPFV